MSLPHPAHFVFSAIARMTIGDFGTLHSFHFRGVYGVSVVYDHVAANFSAQAGSWTVSAASQVLLRYTLIGKTLVLHYEIAETVVSDTPSYLVITLPAGVSAAAEVCVGMHENRDADAAWAVGAAYAKGAELRFYRLGRVPWSISTSTSLHGVATIPLQ
jgi:hypothetical protein